MKRIYQIDPKIKAKPDVLFEMPIVIYVNEFEEKDTKEFSEQMSKAHNTGQPVIPIVIDSYGGQVYSLISMIGEIQAAKLPVATICMGKAMSCGSALLSMGTKGYRYIDPHAAVMIHDVSSMHFGKNEELKSRAVQTDSLQKKLFGLMAKNCDQPTDYFLKILHEKSHAEWFLTAQEAKKHKIVDFIRVPNFKIKISMDITVE